ncbi:hypothetical protein TNIN_346401 [Trichonephila inaurata madagascariensis]|uniref:Mos1 transposase HTH domain-containing protein n=1 Tax=Trichonephila inaurata madagascariensis TaxID=2747483 RepID=A0A8X7C303_9ARAC|nr:hypothetical protein TNIN_346401 [Trichonephila inaurata madagascariensis]
MIGVLAGVIGFANPMTLESMFGEVGEKMRVENHSHIRHIMLYHFEKGWKATQSFRYINELFGKEQSAKVRVGSGLPVSNQVLPVWRISQEEVGHRISTINLFWQP